MQDYQAPRAGPGVLGAKAGVAAGAYTSIVSIIAPAEAANGTTVNVEVRVKNTWTGDMYIAVTGQYDGVNIYPSIDYLIVSPGQTVSFYFAFTMPNKSITFHAWSFYWTGTEWYQDDYSSKAIQLKAAPSPEFSGFAVSDYSKK